MAASKTSINSANAPSTAATDTIVINYLKSRGYKQTESMLRAEARVQSLTDLAAELDPEKSLSDYVLFHEGEELQNPDAYERGYKALRRFVETSLDTYRHELQSTLYPVFVHSYLNLVSKGLQDEAARFMNAFKSDHELHESDIKRLSTVVTPEHLRENELAILYRTNKYNLELSGYSLELFISFLQDQKFMLCLKIVNQHININVIPGKPSQPDDPLSQASATGITGQSAQQLAEFNQQKVTLGQVAEDQDFRDEIERILKEDEATSTGGSSPSATSENDHLNSKDTGSVDDYRKFKQEQHSIPGPSREELPLPPFKGGDIQAEIEAWKSLRKRIALGSGALPSICSYTFHNTNDSLNCVSISQDASLIVGGFSESFVKLWSMKPGEKLKSMKSNFNAASINVSKDLDRIRERHGSDYKRLIGHSGPVFGTSISNDNRYLISCSEDKTARLWSTDTYTSLVVYKGHNYPIWDIDFGPFGFYFATCSHDRTARLWSCDHIAPLRIFTGHLADVDTVKFHPNSKYIVTGSSDKTARLWDVQKGSCVRVFSQRSGNGVSNIAVSPDGQHMACSGEDRSITLWDLGSGRLIKRMTGHAGRIHSLDFSRDGAVLASGASDCTVRIWDVRKGQSSSDSSTKKKKRSNQEDVQSVLNDIGEVSRDVRLEKGLTNGGVEGGSGKMKEVLETDDLLGTFPTKKTPVIKVQFTPRNLLLVAGAYNPLL